MDYGKPFIVPGGVYDQSRKSRIFFERVWNRARQLKKLASQKKRLII